MITHVYAGQHVQLPSGQIARVVGADFSLGRVFYELPGIPARYTSPEIEDDYPSAKMSDVVDVTPDAPLAPRCTRHPDRLAVRQLHGEGIAQCAACQTGSDS